MNSSPYARLIAEVASETRKKFLLLLANGCLPQEEGTSQLNFGEIIRLARISGISIDEFRDEFALNRITIERWEWGELSPASSVHRAIIDWIYFKLEKMEVLV
ncbi:hypothetical protein H0X32_02435 [Patescibacteria group bacterium]|nr:hypothetical protein [Patescibacteria group bacterium]